MSVTEEKHVEEKHVEEKQQGALRSRAPTNPATDDTVTRLAALDTTPWYKKPNLRLLYFLFFPTCIGVEMTSGFDSSMMNGLQAVNSWDTYFNHPRSLILGLMSSMYSLGAVVALPFVPLVTDGIGRRWTIIASSVIMVGGAVIQATAYNFVMFLMARFVLGIGIPFAIVAASSLLGELSHPKERAIMGSLFNACYFIGTNWGWRLPSLLQVVPSALQIIFGYFLPESPRWLVARGRGEEAYEILAKYHAEGDVESELIEKTLEAEKETARVGWTDLLSTSGMRKRILVGSALGVFTQWSGNGLTSYFLARILDNNLVNLANTLWGFANATLFALTVSRYPRRTMYLICSTSLLLIFTGWTIASARYAISGDQGSSRAVIAFIFLYSPAYNVAYNALTYSTLRAPSPSFVELFPYHVRAKAFSRCAGFFNTFVNPIGIANSGWKYYLMYVVFLGFEVVFIFFLFPETGWKELGGVGDEAAKVKARVQQDIQDGNVPIPHAARDEDSEVRK
ncbi:hexose transporter [Coprinellus micaceus]|uniref:Hexose transporter n=1 Tax=Coprinellus micaceus TaxID=71717 RepID=A0A4Y7TDB3_COPMI|nr:hexose transporter [Coprinellus micaceus]